MPCLCRISSFNCGASFILSNHLTIPPSPYLRFSHHHNNNTIYQRCPPLDLRNSPSPQLSPWPPAPTLSSPTPSGLSSPEISRLPIPSHNPVSMRPSLSCPLGVCTDTMSRMPSLVLCPSVRWRLPSTPVTNTALLLTVVVVPLC